MTTALLAALGIFGGLVMAALGDMVSEEARDRLDHLPQAILRLAGRRVDPARRETIYDDEWLPELSYILKGDESRPFTRLLVGTRYAFGILINARRIARRLSRPAPGQPAGTPQSATGAPVHSAPALPVRLLVVLAGARPDVLALCPGEQKKFLSLGVGLLVTSAAASVFVWVTLTAAGLSPVLASLAAPSWGLVNLGIDRWLAISMTKRQPRKLLIAAPRIFLAVTLAGAISLASALTFFQSPVNTQMIRIEINDPRMASSVMELLEEMNDLPGIIHGVSHLEVTRNGKSYEFSGVPGSGPLLQRLQALGELRAGDSAIDTTLVLIGLLGLAVGCLPLAVKLVQRPGLYEELTAQETRASRKKNRLTGRHRRQLRGGTRRRGGQS